MRILDSAPFVHFSVRGTKHGAMGERREGRGGGIIQHFQLQRRVTNVHVTLENSVTQTTET